MVEEEDVLRCFDLVRWLQGKWVPDVVVVLRDGPKRFTELFTEIRRRKIGHRWSDGDGLLSKQTYAHTLHRLEAEGIILRHEEASTVPKSVFYELSPAFRELVERYTREAIVWAREHEDLIERARLHRRQPGTPESA